MEKFNIFVFENVNCFDLDQTLHCGQCFRWYQNDDSTHTGVVRDSVATVGYKDGVLTIKSIGSMDRSDWQKYFDLDLDYESIKCSLSKMHPVLNDASQYAGGIRILCQDSFEALISFIISQNNNIQRIKGIVDRLCESFGEKLCEGYYAFPTCEVLAQLSADDLSPIRAGFRNRYIISAAQLVKSGDIDLEKIRTMKYDDARKELTKITGVGIKVADCALLYGMHRLDAFPIDVWMKRALEVLFGGMKGDEFGEYGGIAQQYIFHYSKMHKELFEN